MKIITKQDVNTVTKPEGTSVSYFLFDEYELHYNEQAPQTTQTWHHYEILWETLMMVEGELTARWKEHGEERSQIIAPPDVVEVEHTPHTFINHTDQIARFLVLKQILKGENNREIFKSDKMLDE